MLGMEMVFKNMLESMGIDVEQLTQEGIKAYNEFRALAFSLAKNQSDMAHVIRAHYELQKSNSDKLDAIMAHFDIQLTKEDVSNATRTLGYDLDGTEHEPFGTDTGDPDYGIGH